MPGLDSAALFGIHDCRAAGRCRDFPRFTARPIMRGLRPQLPQV